MMIVTALFLGLTTYAAKAGKATLGVILRHNESNIQQLVQQRFQDTASKDINLIVLQPNQSSADLLDTVQTICETGITAAVVFSSCLHTEVMTSSLARLGVPHIVVSATCEDLSAPWTLWLPPLPSLVYDVLYDILQQEGVKRLVLLHDHTSRHADLNSFLKRFTRITTSVRVLDLNSVPLHFLWRYMAVWDTKHKPDQRIVTVLLLSCHLIKQVLLQAEQLGFTSETFYWIVANEEIDHEDYINDDWKYGNLVFVQTDYTWNDKSQCDVENNATKNWNMTIEHHYLTAAMDMIIQSLIKTPTITDETPQNISCQKKLRDANISAPSHNTVYLSLQAMIDSKDGFKSKMRYVVRGIDSLFTNQQVTSVLTATWVKSDGLKLNSDDVFTETYNNFEGTQLRVSIGWSGPFASTCDGPSHSPSGLCGLCIRILDEMAAILNFTYEPLIYKGASGSLDKDGNWNGMVALLINGEVDLAVGPTSMTLERAEVIDFTTSYMEDPAAILLMKSKPNSIFRVFSPFSWATWVSIVFSVVVVPVLLWLVEQYSPLRGGGPHSQDTRPPQHLLDVMWQIFATYSLQGAEYHHRSLSSRSLVVFWVLFAIIVDSIYTAILTAILTISTEVAPIANLEDLALNSHYKPLVLQGSNLETAFKYSAANSTYGKLWSRMEAEDLPSTHIAGVERLYEDSSYVFLDDKSVLEYYIKDPKYCKDVILAAESFNPSGLAFMVPKKVPYNRDLSKVISRLQEAGFIEKWRKEIWGMTEECRSSTAEGEALIVSDLSSFLGAYTVMIVNFVVGVTVLVVECILMRHPSYSEWLRRHVTRKVHKARTESATEMTSSHISDTSKEEETCQEIVESNGSLQSRSNSKQICESTDM